MLLKTKLIWFALGTTFVVLLSLFFSLNFSTFSILPYSNSSQFNFQTFRESIDTGYSEGKVTMDAQGTMHLHYKLSTKLEEPFTGVYFSKKDSLPPFFDLSCFNAVRVHIKSKKAKRIPLTITFDYEGFSSKQKEFQYVPYTALIDYKGEGDYEISMDDFKEQSWWYRTHHKTPEDFRDIDFTRANFFIIGSCQLIGAGGEDEIEVSSLEFKNSNGKWYLLAVFILSLFYGGLIIYYYMRQKKQVFVPYVANEVTDAPVNKLEKVMQYIAVNYSNPELDQEDMQRELGISAREIGSLLKENLQTSFKNYLNQIRLAEVKRLLKESDLPISDCAYRAGYNNISHFNRVFKTEVGVSPKQFREEK
jgi:AraC-like DNA-binding protein